MTEEQGARIIELLEMLVQQGATSGSPLQQRAGLDSRVADIIIGGPDELIRQNKVARKARRMEALNAGH